MIVSRLRAAALAAPLLTAAIVAPAVAQNADPASPGVSAGSIVAGLGAIAGVAAVNTVALGIGALPGGAGAAGMATVPAEMAVALSRIYAVSSGVAGAWAADYLYTRHGGDPHGSERLWAAGAGAVVGVAAFNVLTRPFGMLPWAGAAVDPLPVATVVGSRLVAVASAGLGAIGATWIYNDSLGQPTDFPYLFTLLGGALAGVAVTNYVTVGMIGTPPMRIGAGMAQAGGAMASAAAGAASRVWVVASGVAGAVVADLFYRD